MILYADTSALVKTVLLEVDTERVRLWFGKAEQVASSVITFAAFDDRLVEAAEREGFATLGRASQDDAATFPSPPDAL